MVACFQCLLRLRSFTLVALPVLRFRFGDVGASGTASARRRQTAAASRRRAAPGRMSAASSQLDAAAMVFQNPADDGEPEAGALFACRDIGFEQARPVFLRQADAVVDDVDHDVVAVARRR